MGFSADSVAGVDGFSVLLTLAAASEFAAPPEPVDRLLVASGVLGWWTATGCKVAADGEEAFDSAAG